MANVKIVLNREGVRSLLKSEEMKAVCEQHANNAVQRLGTGYEVSSYIGKNRVNASISAVTSEAMRENLENNSILKALR
jgi:hypothetical protein